MSSWKDGVSVDTPVLCWVWDEAQRQDDKPAIVVARREGRFGEHFIDNTGRDWCYATPIEAPSLYNKGINNNV